MAIVLGKDFDNNPGGQMGEALGRGLQQLAQYKMGQLHERHQLAKLGDAYEQMGFPRQLAHLPETAQKAYLSNNFANQQQNAQQDTYEQQAQQFQTPEQQQMPQQTADQLFSQFNVAQQKPQTNRQLVSQAMSGGLKIPQMGKPQLNVPQQAAMQTLSPAQQQAVAPMGQTQPAKQVVQQPQVEAQTATMEQPWQILQKKPRNKLEQEQFKQARAEQHRIETDNKAFVEELDKKGGSNARLTDITLDKLSKLIDSGELTGPTMYNFRKKLEEHGGALGTGIGAALGTVGGAILGAPMAGVGAVGGALAGSSLGAGVGKGVGELIGQKFVGSKEDQEFLKLSLSTFLPRMKDIFGARVAIQEMQVFMDSIPSLSQTDEGKRAIIKNMKLTNDAYRHIKEIKNDIVRRHGGYEPKNLKELVEKESEPYLDALAIKFMENVPTTA